jgi:hypothetical protein
VRRQQRAGLLEAAGQLRPSERSVLDHLARMALPDGSMRWACGDDQLVRETGYCARTIKRARKRLLELGLVELVGGGLGRMRCHYRLIVPEVVEVTLAATASDAPPRQVSPQRGQNVTTTLPIDPRACTDSTRYQLHPSPTASPRESCQRHPDKPGKACRACGTSQRQRAANPRSSGTNPRAGYVTPIPEAYAASPRGTAPPPGLLDDVREQLRRTLTDGERHA